MTAHPGGRSAWAAELRVQGCVCVLSGRSPGLGEGGAVGAPGYMRSCTSTHSKSESGQLPFGMWQQQLERMTHLDRSQDLHLAIYEVAVPDREVW